MEINNILEKIKKYFKDIETVKTVYLFGYQVKGKNRSHSDVDIGLLFSPKLSTVDSFEKKLEFAVNLEDLLDKKVDIVDLEEADLFFVHQVMLNKKIVLDKDINYRVSFEVDRRRKYFDMLPFYDLYHAQALKRLEERLNNG